MATTVARPPVALTVWRHHLPEVIAVPGVFAGTAPRSGDASGTAQTASTLFDTGIRRVALPDVVDLTDSSGAPDAVGALAMVRDLTSVGMAVDWRLRLAADDPPGGRDGRIWGPGGWRLINHLHPPSTVYLGPVSPSSPSSTACEAIRTEWAASHFLCRFVHRHGPGFIQVRDRRLGPLSRFTVDAPEHLAAVGLLEAGVSVTAVPNDVLLDYAAEGLVWLAGDLALWLPYRVRRWPWQAMTL